MEPENNGHLNDKIKLGMLTSFSRALFEYRIGPVDDDDVNLRLKREYGVAYGYLQEYVERNFGPSLPYNKGVFDYLEEAFNSEDNEISRQYEFTRIINWDEGQAIHVIRDLLPKRTRPWSEIHAPNLESITSHVSTEDELLRTVDAYDIDLLLVSYCKPELLRSSKHLFRDKEYIGRIISSDPSDWEFMSPAKSEPDGIASRVIGNLDPSAGNGIYALLFNIANIPILKEMILTGKEISIERQAEARATSEEVDNYFKDQLRD